MARPEMFRPENLIYLLIQLLAINIWRSSFGIPPLFHTGPAEINQAQTSVFY